MLLLVGTRHLTEPKSGRTSLRWADLPSRHSDQAHRHKHIVLSCIGAIKSRPGKGYICQYNRKKCTSMGSLGASSFMVHFTTLLGGGEGERGRGKTRKDYMIDTWIGGESLKERNVEKRGRKKKEHSLFPPFERAKREHSCFGREHCPDEREWQLQIHHAYRSLVETDSLLENSMGLEGMPPCHCCTSWQKQRQHLLVAAVAAVETDKVGLQG